MEEVEVIYSDDKTLPAWKRIVHYDSPSSRRAMLEAYKVKFAKKVDPDSVGFVPELSKGLTKLLQQFSYHPPRIVKVDTFPGAIMQKCYGNVCLCLDSSGGWGVLGWKVWGFKDRTVNLEHHACWVMPDGTMISPTPESCGEVRIMFLQQSELLDWIDDGHLGSMPCHEGLGYEESPKERAARRRKRRPDHVRSAIS